MTTPRKIMLAGFLLLLLSAVILVAAWVERRPIAREIINDYLADRGVKATYELVEIGPKQQRLQNIVIGDPANPDLRVKWAEIDVVTRLSGIEVKAVRASGVRARAQYKDGKLILGSIDKLLPKSSGQARALPDVDVALSDARARLDTDYGQVAARLDGKGNLAADFKGQIGVVAPVLQRDSCSVSNATLFGQFNVRDKVPTFAGPLRIASASCNGNSAKRVDLLLDGSSDAALERFKGTVKLGGEALALSGVDTRQPRGTFDVDFDSIVNRWTGQGNMSAAQITASGVRANGTTAKLNGFYRGDVGQWAGTVALTARQAWAQGIVSQAVTGSANFAGNKAQTRGKMEMQLASLDHGSASVGPTRLDGDFTAAVDASGALALKLDGATKAVRIIPKSSIMAQLTALPAKTKGTPIAELGDALVRDLQKLGSGGDAQARYSLSVQSGLFDLILHNLAAKSRSGVDLVIKGENAIRIASGRPIAINGDLSLSGGGLPTSLIRLASNGGAISGTAIVAPYAAGKTRLALAPTQFAIGKSRSDFKTVATLDTKYKGVDLKGFTTDLSSSGGGFSLDGCRTIRMGALAFQNFALDPLTANACISGNRVKIASPDLSGTFNKQRFTLLAATAEAPLGDGPFWLDAPKINYRNFATRADRLSGALNKGVAQFNADAFFVAMGAGGKAATTDAKAKIVTGSYANGKVTFDAKTVNLAFGPTARRSAMDFDTVDGSVIGASASGKFTNGRGALANVPLDASRANGSWSYTGNVLSANSSLFVRHAVEKPQFSVLKSENFTFEMAGDSIISGGDFVQPSRQVKVARVDIKHALQGGIGDAIIKVDALQFGEGLALEELTDITSGVIELVRGTVTGNGVVRWNPKGVTSDGAFKTDGLNFAAAFGPVTGLKGEIKLSSLLGLETAETQEVTIGSVNPGILAENGVVRYKILPGQQLSIEKGEWPLAGGMLKLEPTVIDMAKPVDRRLVFEVIDLDAATFVEQMQIQNISATGKFSGKLPMVFNATGGRIEKGYLDASGGTLSYIGPISRENLGVYGSIAFDALKSMKFDKLHVDLGGPLDGEMVTDIRFNGVNQLPVTPGRAKLPLPVKVVGLTGIPFIFNISIKAPFRGLVTMGRSFQDAMPLIQQQLEKERLAKEKLEAERLEKEKQRKPSKTRAE